MHGLSLRPMKIYDNQGINNSDLFTSPQNTNIPQLEKKYRDSQKKKKKKKVQMTYHHSNLIGQID